MLLQHHVVEGNGQASPMAAQHRHVFEQRKGERAHAFQQCQQELNTAAQSYTEYKLRLKHQLSQTCSLALPHQQMAC